MPNYALKTCADPALVDRKLIALPCSRARDEVHPPYNRDKMGSNYIFKPFVFCRYLKERQKYNHLTSSAFTGNSSNNAINMTCSGVFPLTALCMLHDLNLHTVQHEKCNADGKSTSHHVGGSGFWRSW